MLYSLLFKLSYNWRSNFTTTSPDDISCSKSLFVMGPRFPLDSCKISFTLISVLPRKSENDDQNIDYLLLS